jgi:hypothetical protein
LHAVNERGWWSACLGALEEHPRNCDPQSPNDLPRFTVDGITYKVGAVQAAPCRCVQLLHGLTCVISFLSWLPLYLTPQLACPCCYCAIGCPNSAELAWSDVPPPPPGPQWDLNPCLHQMSRVGCGRTGGMPGGAASAFPTRQPAPQPRTLLTPGGLWPGPGGRHAPRPSTAARLPPPAAAQACA